MKKAFTLIELLIVIAIIGILASAVVVSLGDATDSAQDSRNKLSVAQLRPIAHLHKLSNNNFDTFCDLGEITSAPGSSTEVNDEVEKVIGQIWSDVGDTTNVNLGCVSKGNDWVIFFKLEAVDNKYWCVDKDSSGEKNSNDLDASVVANSASFDTCGEVF